MDFSFGLYSGSIFGECITSNELETRVVIHDDSSYHGSIPHWQVEFVLFCRRQSDWLTLPALGTRGPLAVT